MIAPVCWRSFVGSRVLIAGLGFFVSIGIAQAQPDLSPLQRPSRPMIEAAQQHYLSGTRFFEQSQWDAALVEFSASFQLSGERDLLHNISWTHEKAGRTKDALEFAERYLLACRGTEDEERAQKRVTFLRQRYGSAVSPPSPSVPAPVVAPTEQTPQDNAATGATAVVRQPERARPPGLAIGLLAGGGALALGGIGCLAGAWVTAQQASDEALTFTNWTGLADRGRALNGAGIALLTVTGGALALGGAVTWVVLARRTGKLAVESHR